MQAVRNMLPVMRTAAPSLRALGVASRGARTKAAAAPKSETTVHLDEMVSEVSLSTHIVKKDCSAIAKELFAQIQERVARGEKITITGFGTFKRTETAARTGRNPKTGDPLEIAASARPAFTAGTKFKDAVKSSYKK